MIHCWLEPRVQHWEILLSDSTAMLCTLLFVIVLLLLCIHPRFYWGFFLFKDRILQMTTSGSQPSKPRLMLCQIRSLAKWKKPPKKQMIPVAFLQLYSVLRKCAQSTFEQNEGLMWNHGNKPDKNSAGWITRAQLLGCLNLLHPPLSFFFFFMFLFHPSPHWHRET